MPSSTDVELNIRQDLFIGGEYVDAAEGSRFEVLNPATGSVLAEVAEARAEDVDRAVKNAHAAFEGEWGQMEIADRARILRRIAALLDERAHELGMIESLDGGKPIQETTARVRRAAIWFEYFADIALKFRSSVIPSYRGHLNYTLRQPHGVVGAIIPWNYPIWSCALKIPAALAMGNTVVLKPAELAPLTPIAIAEVCADAGLPAGALNIVPGYGAEAGRALVAHPQVRMVAFTGSTAVGREIASVAGQRLVPVVLELGGKSPNVVFADADLDRVAMTSLFSYCHNQGQVCTAGTRVLVEESAADDLLERLAAYSRDVRVGDPLDADTEIGAVISEKQLERIERYVDLGQREGAELLVGGARPEIQGHENGFFYTPTIFANVANDMTIAQEEIFGPVVSIIPFRDEAHALQLANDVSYGLAATVWTSDVGRAHRMAERMHAGIVWVNTMHTLSPGSPIGGWKDSGLGAVGGEEAAESYSRLKSVWLNFDATTPTF